MSAAGHIDALVRVEDIHTYYGKSHILHGVSLEVRRGEIVGLLGRNGVGKSTTLKAIMGLVHPTRGEVLLEGQSIGHLPAHRLARLGIGYVPEDRRIFRLLTVSENLRTGLDGRGVTEERKKQLLDMVFDYFPVLAERRAQAGGTLSGGEQQMLAIGRALMTDPVLLALDEPSLGLAPLIIDRIYEVIAKLRDEMKMTVLLVEQNAQRALDIADYAYILETGRVVLDGTAAKLSSNEDVQEFYLGVSSSGRRSLRDVKHYKRRKRWLS